MNVTTFLTLIAPYFLIVVSVLSLLGNGIILLVVAKNASLRQKDCLYLIAALAVADFLTAAGTIPYGINMLRSNNTNCTAGNVLWSVAGNVSGVRMNQICTLFLALDRLYALYRPFAYRVKNHLKIAQFVITISFLWSVSEVAANALTQDLNETKSSCTTGVAYTYLYRYYRLFSNLTLNLGTQLLYAIVFYKIRKLGTEQSTQSSRDRFQQANKTISLLFITSLLFMVLPSLWSVFYQFYPTISLGPILSVFPCLNGAVNILIYGLKHRDFRIAIKDLFSCRGNQIGLTEAENPPPAGNSNRVQNYT